MKVLINLISIFIPSKKIRRKFRHFFLKEYVSKKDLIKKINNQENLIQSLKKSSVFYNGKEFLHILPYSGTVKLLKDKILSNKPFLIARYGSVEFSNITDGFCKTTEDKNRVFKELCNNAGFFPNENGLLDKFKKTYEEAEKEIDILAVWIYCSKHEYSEEVRIETLSNIKILCHLNIFSNFLGVRNKNNNSSNYEYFMKNSWTSALKNKKVLVIHPFKDSIESQYKKLSTLDFFPKFKKLTVIKAIQTAADQKDDRFKTWFDSLDYMKKEIDKADFDIAIIGCGSYGMPLGAYIKQINKQAIHAGGATQLLFAIKGRRWVDRYKEDLVGDYWTYPLESEKPKGFEKVEGGTYW